MENKPMSMTTRRHGLPMICSGMLIHICKIIILYKKISVAVSFSFLFEEFNAEIQTRTSVLSVQSKEEVLVF